MILRLPRRRPLVVAVWLGVVGISSLALSSCSADDQPSVDPGTASVAVSFYPLQYVVEQIGGDRVSVTNLTKPGAEPHDLELAPQDLATMEDADLTVYLAGFQPAVDDAVSATSATAFDVSSAADLTLASSDGAVDPHFWLDPMRLAAVGDTVAAQLGDIDPQGASTYQRNAATLRGELTALDRSYRRSLDDCSSRYLVTSHAAFGYLAGAYGLDQVGLTGLSPETEPTASDLADVTDFVQQHDVTTIFYETLVSPDVAETVARATGARTSVLDPIEGLTDESAGNDYLEVMASNLTSLREGLRCA